MTQLRLKEVCKEKGMTLNALAEKIEISRVSLSGIATGKQKPSFDTLEKLADGLGVGIAELFAAPADSLRCPKCGAVIKFRIEDENSTDKG